MIGMEEKHHSMVCQKQREKQLPKEQIIFYVVMRQDHFQIQHCDTMQQNVNELIHYCEFVLVLQKHHLNHLKQIIIFEMWEIMIVVIL